MTRTSKHTSKKSTTAASPTKKITKPKTLKISPQKASKAKSQFVKEVTLFRDQRDMFTMDATYAKL
jgi:hypothetical protein